MVRKEAPLDVRIPSALEDRPVLSRVGLVAVIGFALGIAWPKLLGVKLGPEVPGGSQKGPESPAEIVPAAPGSAAASPPDDDDDDAAPQAVTNKQRAVLTSLAVARCRDDKGKKLEQGSCAPLAADRWIEPRLRELASCPEAIGLEGDMELELELDFDKKSVRVDQSGKGGKSAFPSSTVRGVLKCAGDELGTLELEKIAHTQPRVTLVAKVRFVPPGKALEAEPTAEGGAEGKAGAGGDKSEGGSLGTATVSWEKALLRDAPKDGKVVARAPQGSRVKILEQRDEWYLVQPAKGDAKGWVYRQAIGK